LVCTNNKLFQYQKEDKIIQDEIVTRNYIYKTTTTTTTRRISSSVKGNSWLKIQKRIDLIQAIIYMRFPELFIEG
jgi:hypothetical protein